MRNVLIIAVLTVSVLPAIGEGFLYNTGGQSGFVPDLFGSSTGWGEWFVATVYNDTGKDLQILEFGFPCCGPATGAYGWVVWMDVGGYSAPAGLPTSADYHGSFTPVEPAGGDPTVYTYVDVSMEGVIVPVGAHFCFGYENTQYGGQTTFNGTMTWSWDNGNWIADSQYNRTAVMQVSAEEVGSLSITTWGGIKSAVLD